MTMSKAAFPDAPRIDARDKVRGAARFAADDVRPGLVHAALAIATIGRGRILSIDSSAARTVDGVLLVLTHEDVGDLKSPGFLFAEGFGFQSFQPMQSDVIAYRGQPIAIVAADTLEAAIEAAALIRATYATESFNVTLDASAGDIIAQAESPLPQPMFADRVAGDADRAFADAPVKVDAVFTSPPQHQNPMELIAAVVEWQGGRLIVHEGTQNAGGIRQGLAHELGLAADQVEVISPYVGGGFGQKNSLQMHTVLAAIAARRTRSPRQIGCPAGADFP